MEMRGDDENDDFTLSSRTSEIRAWSWSLNLESFRSSIYPPKFSLDSNRFLECGPWKHLCMKCGTPVYYAISLKAKNWNYHYITRIFLRFLIIFSFKLFHVAKFHYF